MAASMYTNSIHRETVGKHTPRSGKQRRNKYYSRLSTPPPHTHTVFSHGGKTQTLSHTDCGLLRDINTHVTSYGCECHCWVTLEGSGSNWTPLPPPNWHWDFNLTRGFRATQRGFTKSNWYLAQAAQLTYMQHAKNSKSNVIPPTYSRPANKNACDITQCNVLKISGNNINAKSHKGTESLYLCATHTAPTHRYWQQRRAIALGWRGGKWCPR